MYNLALSKLLYSPFHRCVIAPMLKPPRGVGCPDGLPFLDDNYD
jgi:hypothetical protein